MIGNNFFKKNFMKNKEYINNLKYDEKVLCQEIMKDLF